MPLRIILDVANSLRMYAGAPRCNDYIGLIIISIFHAGIVGPILYVARMNENVVTTIQMLNNE